jgi:hypothetical protein
MAAEFQMLKDTTRQILHTEMSVYQKPQMEQLENGWHASKSYWRGTQVPIFVLQQQLNVQIEILEYWWSASIQRMPVEKKHRSLVSAVMVWDVISKKGAYNYTVKKNWLHTYWIVNVISNFCWKKIKKKVNGAEFKIFLFNFNCNSIWHMNFSRNGNKRSSIENTNKGIAVIKYQE